MLPTLIRQNVAARLVTINSTIPKISLVQFSINNESVSLWSLLCLGICSRLKLANIYSTFANRYSSPFAITYKQ